MIYNEELANLVNNNSIDIKKEDKSSEILKLERNFLKVIISRLEEEIKEGNIINGKVYISFASYCYGHDDLGYNEIHRLIHSNFFHSFASEYKIYFDGESIGKGEYDDSYISLVWDYEAYKKGLEKKDYELPPDYEELIEERERVERILAIEKEKRKKEEEEIKRKEEEKRSKLEYEKLQEEFKRHLETQRAFERLRRKYNRY